MSPLVLALVWVVAGVGVVLPPRLRRRRLTAAVPLLLGVATLVTTSSSTWPGPAASTSFGGALAFGRPGAGFLTVAAVALAVTLWLAPALEGGELPAAAVVGAAAVVMLSATVPVIWGLAGAVATGALVVRWIATSPDRATLAAGRVAGAGAAALLAAATLFPATLGQEDARARVAGALLATGAGALLALVPLGGWATAAVTAVRGADLALWTLLLAPALLLSLGAALPALPAATRDAAATDLLALGLLSGIYSAVQAFRAPPAARYGRLWIADLALAAAGLASLHDAGRLGGMLIVLTHVAVGPLLLHAPRPGLERPHRVAWLTLTGLPPMPAFWGRLLVLEGLAQTSGVSLALGLAAVAGTTVTTVRALVATDGETAGRTAGPLARALGWTVCLGALSLGLAPAAIAERVFGTSFT